MSKVYLMACENMIKDILKYLRKYLIAVCKYTLRLCIKVSYGLQDVYKYILWLGNIRKFIILIYNNISIITKSNNNCFCCAYTKIKLFRIY